MSLLDSTLLVVAAYLAGSIPFGLVIGLALGIDIRHTGSGNIGATNLARGAGRKWGILAFLLDYAKGLAPVLAALHWGGASAEGEVTGGRSQSDWLPVAAGAAAVLGHVFPLYLRFRGGKGVATAFGAMTALSWPATAAAGALWGVIFLATRTVSIASIAAALALPAGVAVLRALPAGTSSGYLGVQGFAITLAALILVRHRQNIVRLFRGEELRFR